MKKILSVILSAAMVVSALPMSAKEVKAEGYTIQELFGDTIDAPQLKYIAMNEYNDVAEVWYDSTEDLDKYGYELLQYPYEGFNSIEEKYGVISIEVSEQTDSRFDNEAWHFDPSWINDFWSDWSHNSWGEDGMSAIRHSQAAYFRDEYAYDDPTGHPYISFTEDEWGNKSYYADLENHTLYVRMRTVVKIVDSNYDLHTYFSPWSNTLSVGKNGTQTTPQKPTKLDAPVLSDIRIKNVDDYSTEYSVMTYSPYNAFEAEMYYDTVGDFWDTLVYDFEVSVNNGPWVEHHLGNGDVIRSGRETFTVDVPPTEDVRVRCRFISTCDENLVSPWSNIIWNNDTCATGHTIEYVPYSAPLCTERGNIEHWRCSVCYSRFKDSSALVRYEDPDEVWIEALGHNYTITLSGTAEPADCVYEGHEDNLECSRCGDWIYGEAIPKKPHNFGEALETHPATCEDNGYVIKHCSSCNEDYKIETEPWLGHDWDYANAVVVEKGTCTAVGKIKVTCKRDSSHTEIQDSKEGGEHSWDAGKVQKAPTCEVPGVMLYTCKNDKKHTKTEPIPKKGHDFSDKTSPTCKHCNASNPNYSQKAAEEAMASKYNVDKSTLAITDSSIKKSKNDKDINGATFGKLKLRQKSVGKKDITVQWTKYSGADGYILYGNKCGKKNSYVELKTFGKNTTSYKNTGLKSGAYYKYVIRAYKLVNGKKVTIAASKTVHIATKGGKNGNAKAVNISKFKTSKSATKVTLKKGKSVSIKAKEVKKDQPIAKHVGLRYESSDSAVATVSKSGKITAKKAGKCEVYVYAQNGLYKAIKVTVK